jgi:glycosyltransferase involved in cell wall biosynthesis
MKAKRTKEICYILSYYSPNYIRTTTLIAAIKGLENLTVYEARNSTGQIFRYFQTLVKLLFIRVRYNPEFYILGFRGYELFWIVRLVTWGKCLVFDHMMSPYDSLLNERNCIKPGGLLEKLIYRYEQSILNYSDIILSDTFLHKDFFSVLFRVNPAKIYPIYISTDENTFDDARIDDLAPYHDSFEIFFYGSFQPLHGVDIMLKAAALLSDIFVHFTFVGGNKKNLSGFHRLIEELELKNIHHQVWVDYKQLPRLIHRADLCLGGPFGNTGQAHRVITGKTFQFLAMGKPTVIGEINQEDGFEDKKNCLLVAQGDENILADTIRWGYHHPDELLSIGQRGRKLYLDKFSIEKIREELQVIFES